MALRLRDQQLPVSTLQAVVYVLRGFEARVKDELSEFKLPDSLREADVPDLRIVIGDGRDLYVRLEDGANKPKMFGPIKLRAVRDGDTALEDLERGVLPESDEGAGSRDRTSFGGPEGSRYWRVEVSVTRVARGLDL